jgi:hypothetical protein
MIACSRNRCMQSIHNRSVPPASVRGHIWTRQTKEGVL